MFTCAHINRFISIFIIVSRGGRWENRNFTRSHISSHRHSCFHRVSASASGTLSDFFAEGFVSLFCVSCLLFGICHLLVKFLMLWYLWFDDFVTAIWSFRILRKKLVLESCAGNCVEDCSSHWWSANFFDQFQSTIFFIIFQFFNQFFQHFRKKLVLESCVGNCVEDCGSHWWSTNFLKTLKEQKLSICYNIFYQLHFIDQTMWSANIQFSFSSTKLVLKMDTVVWKCSS